MPRKEVDYSKTVIYKIVCNDLNIKDCYVGHTTDFTKRKNQHKTSCNNSDSPKYMYPVYTIIRKNGGWSNWDMIEVEKISCSDANEARARERYYYELLNGSLNKQVPLRTTKEYVEANYEKTKQYQSEYHKINKDRVAECRREYFQNNKEQIKLKQKEYAKLDKEGQSRRSKKYHEAHFEANKDKINARRRELRALKKQEQLQQST